MPLKGSKKLVQPLPPAIQTRIANKTTRPAANAGLIPKTRATKEEVQQKRDQLAKEAKSRSDQVAQAQQHVAEIEDRLRHEDIERDATANHPPHSGATSFKPSARRVSNQCLLPDDNSDIQSGEEYQPPASKNEDQDEDASSSDLEEPNVEDGMVDDQQIKRHGNAKPRHEDISTLRATDDVTGTPGLKRKADTVSESTERASIKTVKKKRGSSNKAAFNTEWFEISKQRSTQQVAKIRTIGENTVDDDSLVKMSGFVRDEEDDQAERKEARKGPIQPASNVGSKSMIKIIHTKHVATKTELRGGKKKWTHNHLPPNTDDKFKNDVLPLVKEKVGTLAPWSNLPSTELQNIVDRVYGINVYDIDDNPAWAGLVSYRIQSWRNRFAQKAIEAVKMLFDNPDYINDYGTPEGRRVAVAWWLDWQGPKHKQSAPYQWRKCIDDEDGQRHKQGFCKTPLIVYTFAHAHLAYIRTPNVDNLDEDLPAGALILSLQAVEHALKEYLATGTRKTLGDFSFDNYGDRTVSKEMTNGQFIDRFDPRATRYMATIKNFDRKKYWGPMLREANEILSGSSKGQGRKARSVSQASPEPDTPQAEEVYFLSDRSWESDSGDKLGA
ncbi:hypothetical protein C0992_004140 [Termitomyces sp. T32_za158]|nr:hypothetical protein C0992_004140 [Termitomyces sp. T32_za158]